MIDDTVRGMISVWMGISMKSYEDFNEYTEGMEYLGSDCRRAGILEPLLLTLISLVRIEQRIMKLFPSKFWLKKWRLILGRLLKRLLRRPKLKG